jgi:hypothetical protein
VAAKKPQADFQEGPKSMPNVTCSDYQDNFESATITSPNFPAEYDNYVSCLWLFENQCAHSFTITPNFFSLEGHTSCGYDYLQFTSIGGGSSNVVFCGDSTNNDIYTDDHFMTTGFNESLTVYGSELQIVFATDYSVVSGGFNIDVVANTREGCSPGIRPAESCLAELGDNEYPNLAYWPTNALFDKPVPFSELSIIVDSLNSTVTGIDLRNDCIEQCVQTAGCFKIKADSSSS